VTGGDGASRGTARTVVAGFLLYGALFTDRLAPLFLAERIGRSFDVGGAALGLLPFAIALGWTLGLAAGRLSSRWLTLRQRVVVGTFLTAAASCASALAPTYVVFLLLRLLGGVAANVVSPALIALCVRAVAADRRGTALGVVQSSTRITGSFLAPIALTAAVVPFGWRWAIAGAASTLLLAAAAVAVLLPASPTAGLQSRHSRPPVYRPEGPRIIALASATAVCTFLWLTLVSQGGVPLLEGWLEVDIRVAGRLLAWFGIGSTVAALAIPAWSDQRRGLALSGASAVTALAGSALAVASLLDLALPLMAVGALFGLAGVGLGALPLSISVLPADAVQEGDVDRAVEVPIISAELLGGALLPAAAFAIAARLGIDVALLASALLFALLAVIGGPLLDRWHRPAVSSPTRRRDGAPS
jgi:predicted MFS family arabinose efflux permease